MTVNSAQRAKNFANRGRQCLETFRYDLAVDMLKEAIALAPRDVEVRKLLRTAQVMSFKHAKKPGLLAKLSCAAKRAKVAGLIKKGRCEDAMAAMEEAMEVNPLDPANIAAAVKAAESAGMPEHAAVTVEAAYECSGKDPALLERLATYYSVSKQWEKARDAYQKILSVNPGDQRILRLLKTAEAQLTISSGWAAAAGKKNGYRDILKDKAQADAAGQEGHGELTGEDLAAAILRKKAEVQASPKNANARRQLAKLYVKAKAYADAVAELEELLKAGGDPELDRMLSQSKMKLYDARIAAETDSDKKSALEAERDEFSFADLQGRAAKYPNDLHIRFELGGALFGRKDWDGALAQFQLAQKSPKDRLASLLGLAKCFLAKGQFDMAEMQLETLRDQMPVMEGLKKDATYWLGRIAEESLEDLNRAYSLYKEVYAVDVGFEDLGERILSVSEKIKARKGN